MTTYNPVNIVSYPSPSTVALTCMSRRCRHTYEPDPESWDRGDTACPRCGGWTMAAELVEPTGGAA